MASASPTILRSDCLTIWRAHAAQPDLLGAFCSAPGIHGAGVSDHYESHGRSGSVEWAKWVLLLALGGFIGNFIFSLTDHAGNGFLNPLEWVPVVASAIAVGFLAVPLILRVPRPYIDLCAAILFLEAGVGVWGFVLHAAGNLRGPSLHAYENFIYGAPPMAPLLFPNLKLLAVIGLWQLRTLDAGEIRASRG